MLRIVKRGVKEKARRKEMKSVALPCDQVGQIEVERDLASQVYLSQQ